MRRLGVTYANGFRCGAYDKREELEGQRHGGENMAAGTKTLWRAIQSMAVAYCSIQIKYISRYDTAFLISHSQLARSRLSFQSCGSPKPHSQNGPLPKTSSP